MEAFADVAGYRFSLWRYRLLEEEVTPGVHFSHHQGGCGSRNRRGRRGGEQVVDVVAPLPVTEVIKPVEPAFGF